MTAVTESEIRSSRGPGVAQQDSPAVPTRTRARIPVTQSIGKISQVQAAIKLAARRWWVWTERPASLATAWRLSAVQSSRTPGNSAVLRTLWTISNRSDRLAVFALALLLPTFLTGPLRWIVQRPTRRVGLYLILAATAVAWLTT